MLDVHPSHSPTHTWKDFFIHIATITVGLLIAVGLEQTVELFHRRHQRHQLEEQLRVETLRNINIALQNIDAFTALKSSLTAQYVELQSAAREHRSPQAIPFSFGPGNAYPKSAAWVVAQQNATLGLLSGAKSQLWVSVYRIADRAATSMQDEWNARKKISVARFPAQLFNAAQPESAQAPSFDYSRMTNDQLRILSETLAAVIESDDDCVYRNRSLYVSDWAA
jgi:hypothetical protein